LARSVGDTGAVRKVAALAGAARAAVSRSRLRDEGTTRRIDDLLRHQVHRRAGPSRNTES